MGGIKTAKWSENETIHPGSPEDDHSSLNLSRGEMTRATGLTLVSPLVTIPLLLAKHLFPLPPTQPVFCGGDFHKSVTSAIAWAFLIDSISFGKGREVGQPQWSALFPFFFACSAFALSCIPYKLRRERDGADSERNPFFTCALTVREWTQQLRVMALLAGRYIAGTGLLLIYDYALSFSLRFLSTS